MMYKLWNKTTCYEIYFRPLSNSSQVEVITYLNGDPFVNPMSRQHLDIKDPEDNTEVWSIEDARENWNAWVTHGGYEVSEVEDYLHGTPRTKSRGDSMNYIKSRTGTVTGTVIPQHIEKFLIDYMKEGK